MSDTIEIDRRLGRGVRYAAILTAVWTIPVILGTAGHFFGEMVSESGRESMPREHIFAHSFAMWYVWIPATPLIFAVYRRWSLRGPTWFKAATAHVATLAGLFLMQSFTTLVAGHATGHIPPFVTWSMNMTQLVVNLLLYDLCIYVSVVAIAYGIDYAKRYRDRDLRASQLETLLERSRVETLQAQLQPHFLFNALNAIAMLVRRDQKQEAVNVVVGFSELLRYVLDESGTMDVPLSEELRFVRRYLDIERVRLGDRLNVTIDVAPGVEQAQVPNLLLQPLVENALKHSIAVRPDGGRVQVRAERRGDVLRVSVQDDGPGLPPDFVVGDAHGVGLRNLRDRLAAFFGAKGTLSITNAASGGVLAVVEIPYAVAAPSATRVPAVKAG